MIKESDEMMRNVNIRDDKSGFAMVVWGDNKRKRVIVSVNYELVSRH